MVEHGSRYRKLKIRIPDSAHWKVKNPRQLEDKDELFDALRIGRKQEESFALWIEQYRWDYTYSNEEDGTSVGGDNIGGLAKRSERWIREYFKDIKERKPLRKCRSSPP